MKPFPRLVLPALLLASPVTLAQPRSPEAPAEAPAARTISVQFRGSLRDALQKIAQEGGLNVVATGALDTSVEVHLKDIHAEQALRTVARAYSLRLEHDGSIFTLRPMTAEERARAEQAPPVPSPPSPGPALPPSPSLPLDIQREMAELALDKDELKQRVREGMERVKRSGQGSRAVVARGHSLEVREGETVDSAVVYGGNLRVKGIVEEDAVTFGGNLEIHGRVEGDAHAFGGNVLLGPTAVVEGDVSSFGGEVIRDRGARVEGSSASFGGANIGRLVAGEIKRNMATEARETFHPEEERDFGGGFATFLLWFATLFGLGFVGQLLFPARLRELRAEIKAQPLRSGVVGLLGLLAMLPLTLVLTVTLIGIPVMVALWVAAILTTALGFAAVASELGLRLPLLRGRKTQALVLALGLLLLLLVGRIPVLGPFVLCLATLVAFGAVIRTRFGHRSRGMPEPIIPDQGPV